MNPLSYQRIHFRFIICYANSLFIHYHFREFTLNSKFSREFTMNSLSVIRIHYRFITFFANSLWFHYHFRKRNMNWLSVKRNHFEFAIYFANILLNHYLSCEFIMNLLFFSRKYCEFTICFLNLVWTHYFYRRFLSCFSFPSLTSYLVYMVMNEIFDLKMTVFYPRMSFLTLSMTLNDHDSQAIRIGIKFYIE